MLEMFSAFNLIALAVISALFLWVLAVAVAEQRTRERLSASDTVPCGCPCALVGAMGALAPIFKGIVALSGGNPGLHRLSINLGNYVWELGTGILWSTGGRFPPQAPDRTSRTSGPSPTALWNR